MMFTVPFLAVTEQPEALPWLIAIGCAFILGGCAVTWVTEWAGRTHDGDPFCGVPGPVVDSVEAVCRLLNGHRGHHVDPLLGVGFGVELIACFSCTAGLYRWLRLPVATCDACGHAADLELAVGLHHGERLAIHHGWAVIISPVSTSSVD